MKGQVDIILLQTNSLLFNLNQSEDVHHVLEGGTGFFGKKGPFLERWHRRFRPATENIEVALAWVSHPNLPMDLWNMYIIARVARAIEDLIVNGPTKKAKTRMIEARFSVNSKLVKNVPRVMKMHTSGGLFEQQVKQDYLPD